MAGRKCTFSKQVQKYEGSIDVHCEESFSGPYNSDTYYFEIDQGKLSVVNVCILCIYCKCHGLNLKQFVQDLIKSIASFGILQGIHVFIELLLQALCSLSHKSDL